MIRRMTCLYGIARLIMKRYISFDDIITRVANCIPPAMQYPDDACVRIMLEDKAYYTDGFSSYQCRMSTDIVINGKNVGWLEVCYPDRLKIENGAPFLSEENNLIRSFFLNEYI